MKFFKNIMAESLCDLQKPNIYYVSNIPYYYAPDFPLVIGKVPNEFNVLLIQDLKTLYKHADNIMKENARVQKIIVLNETLHGECHNSTSGHGGYRRIMSGSSYVFPIDNKTYSITEFMLLEDWNLKSNQVFTYQPDCLTNDISVVKRFIDHAFPISGIENATFEIILYAINKHKQNLNHIPSAWITNELREEIRKLYIQGNLKDISVKIELLYDKPPEFTDDEVTDIKNWIDMITQSDEIISHFDYENCCDILGTILNGTVLSGILIDWLMEYRELPNTLTHKLSTIGYADEHHKKNRHWKSHIRQKTKAYLNITEACCIFDHKSFKAFIKDYYQIFNLIVRLGFNLVFHEQSYWRRGTGIDISTFNKDSHDFGSSDFKPDKYDSDVINILIHNPHVTDIPDESEKYATESDTSD